MELIKWDPRNYQMSALNFMIMNRCGGLFLDPGLGKTSTSLAAIKILMGAGLSKGVLLIAPLRVCQIVWPGEIRKWENFNKITHTFLHGGAGKFTLQMQKKDIYLINPEGLPWLYNELLKLLEGGWNCPFDTLIIDESTKFKNPTAKTRFELLKDMLPLFKRRYILTGTPAPSSLIDLWSQMYILDRGKSLGDNFYKFRNSYFSTYGDDKYNWHLKEGSAEKIQEAVAPLVLEMSAKDHLKLPPLIFNDVEVVLPDKALEIYKEMENNFFIMIDEDVASAQAAAQASMKCHQISNGRVYEDIDTTGMDEAEERLAKRNRKPIQVHKAKLEALSELLGELNGKPLLIAYHYKHDLEALRGLLGKNVPYIGSGVSESKVQETIDRWNSGKIPVLLGHPVSMSHGLNMQAYGRDICWFSLTWNLETYLQFNARLYRQGVDSTVRIHHLIAQNTIDVAMLKRLGKRAEQQQDLRDAIKAYRKEMTIFA